MYDYWLGGHDNFAADRIAALTIADLWPESPLAARENRKFLGRAVRFLAGEAGIRQFIDLGTGIPIEGNVHEVAQRAAPGARVAYVDNDPVAIAHSRALLAGSQNAAIIDADLRDPKKILADQAVGRLIDFGRPTGLLLVSVLHFIADAEDPWQIVATLRDALAPGSYLVVSHAASEGKPVLGQAFEKVYNRSVSTQVRVRSGAEILRFFDGFELVDPGLGCARMWRPDSPADVPSDPGRFWGWLAGVGRKR
jgi:hypothetical protein